MIPSFLGFELIIFTSRRTDPCTVQVKLAIVAEKIGKLGLAAAVICFVAQMIIWLVGMSKKVRNMILLGLKIGAEMIFVSVDGWTPQTCFKMSDSGTRVEACFVKEAACLLLPNSTFVTSYSNFIAGTQLNNVVRFSLTISLCIHDICLINIIN